MLFVSKQTVRRTLSPYSHFNICSTLLRISHVLSNPENTAVAPVRNTLAGGLK